MTYLNLYHKGMEDYLMQLDSKLRKHGFTGQFKKIEEWDAFGNIFSNLFNVIYHGFAGVGYLFLRILRFLFYPLTYLWRKITPEKVTI